MARVRSLALLGAVSFLSFLAVFIGPGSRDASAQQFGRNKVEYVDFDFKVLDTEHFAVYYYSSEEASARLAARLAERWYARLSRVLGHSLRNRQALILYGSQPEFAQTNVVAGFLGEGVGGVTESARRRIVIPFAPTLAETDQVLGHELAHAFQFDMVRGFGGLNMWPLWGVEGMAQYLSLGADDREAVMWLRDAVKFELLPKRATQAAQAFSPYRYGSAMWSYLAGRFGDRVLRDILSAAGAGTLDQRIRKVTGVELEQLFADWRATAYETYGSQPAGDAADSTNSVDDQSLLLRGRKNRKGATGTVAQSKRARCHFLFGTGSPVARSLPGRCDHGRDHAQTGHDDGHGAVRKPAGHSIRGIVESGRRSVRVFRDCAGAAGPRHS